MKAFESATLPNGLRIICEQSPTDTVYCGLHVSAGTRHEDALDTGLAHFCEHTSFKGTERRRSHHIRSRLDIVGGDVNAYTNKEETVYYAAVAREHFERAADLLFDMVFHSVYPQTELDKEVQVIVDEIDSYNDSPAELIYDEFEEMLFCGSGLGRNILGNEKRLREFRTEDALRFTRKYYVPSNVTFFVYGRVPFKRVLQLAERFTVGLLPGEKAPQKELMPTYKPERRVQEHSTHQAHVLIGNRGYSFAHPDKTALFLLNNMIGGPGMNSLLNVSLREQRGLVYTVESTAFSYMDAGMWSVYYGCDEADVNRCRRIVLNTLRKLTSDSLTETALRNAKRQLIGQIRIASDNFESYALALGKTFARTGKHRDVDEICERIMALSAQDVLRVGQDIFQEEKLSMLVYQ